MQNSINELNCSNECQQQRLCQEKHENTKEKAKTKNAKITCKT